MTKQLTKVILLAAAVTVAVGASMYLSREQRRIRDEAARAGTPLPADPADAADIDLRPRDSSRSRGGELRHVIRGFAGDLADAQRRVTGEGEQVVARLKLGREGRRLGDVLPAPARPESEAGGSPDRG